MSIPTLETVDGAGRLGPAALAVAIGLFLGSVLTVAVHPFWFFVFYPVGYLIGHVAVRAATRAKWVPRRGWLGTLLLVVVGWPLLTYAPFGLRLAHLRGQAEQAVPQLPDTEALELRSRLLCNGITVPGCVESFLITRRHPFELGRFYERALSERGWRRQSFESIDLGHGVAAVFATFDRGPARLQLRASNGTRRYAPLSWPDHPSLSGGSTWIEMTYYPRS